MNLEITLATIGLLALGCAVAKAMAQLNGRASKDFVLALGLLSGTGVLLAMGSIEMAGRYGYSVILALVAFTLVFVFSPLIFFPIRRLSEIIRFATPVDFLTFRYRTRSVALITCTSLIITTVPLILAQLIAIESVASRLLAEDAKILAVIFTTVAIILINLRAIQKGPSNHLGWIMAAAGLLLLPALGFSAWTSVQSVFGGLAEMNSWVIDSGQRFIVQRLDSSYSIFAIFLAASFASPIYFSLLVSDNISDRQAGMTAWSYPLLVLLASIPIFPLLWAGISVQASSPLQEYLYALPILSQHPLVAALGFASIILLGLSLSCSLTLINSKIFLNSFLLPAKNLEQQPHLDRWIKKHQILVAAALVLVCAGLSLIVKSRSITDYYLAGFSGMAQLTPALLAVIYLPRVNRQGVIAGLVGGITVWFIGILVPLLFGDWSWQLPLTENTLHFGMQNWNIWAIEALLVNITLCTIFAVYGSMDKEQQAFATLCMADNVYIPARVEIAQKSVPELTASLRLSLGENADTEITQALESLDFDISEVRPAALRQIRDSINASLNMRFGVLAANRIMEQSLPLILPAADEPDDIQLIESVLAIQGDRLTGIASELNKLRVHHREILDNLPIGVVSLDQSGEIVRWNTKIVSYTGISQAAAPGSLVSDLPEPWGAVFTDFIDSGSSNLDDLRLDIDDQVRWFSLQTSIQQEQVQPVAPEANSDIVVLIEEQTESIKLIQSSIDNERLASVGRLAAGVAHEIGNPVTGIACLAQNLQHETEDQQIHEAADQILSQTQRINRIVESLINFSRGGYALNRSKQQVNLNHVLAEAIQLLTISTAQQTEQQSLEYICDLDSDLCVTGDHHQLIQVFLNLLSNARDASPEGGRITISAETEGQKIVVAISDEGIGLQDSLQDHLFEPFVTTKDPGKGTGLGLWIVFNLVKSLGGEVSLASPAKNNDCGTTVTIYFPLSSAV